MDYTTSEAYNYNETTKQYTKCYPLTHMNAVYTKDDESETLGNKLADIDNAIDDNTNKIGVLSSSMDNVNTQLSDMENNKVDKVTGKGLSTNDYDNTEKAEVAKIASKADVIYVDTKVQGAVSGAPKAVSLVVNMVDTTKNYVYTGSESGYTSGNWYYYNGSTWVSGGVYQSAGIAYRSIDREKVANNAIHYEHISFMEKSVNLFDYNDVTDAYAISSQLGSLYASANDSASNYIEIEPSTQYTLNYKRPCAYYDSSKTFISGEGTSNNSVMTITTPSNAKFIRLTIETSKKSLLQFEIGATATTYKPYYALLDGKHLKDKSVKDTAITGKIGKLKLTNMFNKDTITSGKKINNTTGLLIDSTSYSASDYIEVNPNTNYTRTDPSNYAFYDINKTFISGGTSGQTITTPSNCYYIRISVLNTILETAMMVEGSTLPATYTSYGYDIYADDGIVLNINNKNKWKGKTMSTFGDSITAQAMWQMYVVKNLQLAGYNNYGVSGTKVSGDSSDAMWQDARINLIDANSDIITFMGGMNDWRNDVTLGTIGDTDTNTFYGAVKAVAEKLITRFPAKRILFMGTSYGLSPNRTNSSTGLVWSDTTGYKNNLNLTSGDYGKVIIEVARMYGIPCVDIYGEAGWNKINIATYVQNDSSDGAYIHPNSDGGKRISGIVIGKLKNIEPV